MGKTHIEELQVEILGWKKYNPRSDVEKPSWFRLEHSFMFDPEWDHFDGQEISVWVYLLCYANFKNRPLFDLDLDSVSRRARVPLAKVESAIEKLTKLKCISITSRARDADVTSTSPTRRDERNETNVTRRDEVAPETAPAGEPAPDFFPGLAPQDLADLWNAHCGSLPKASKLNPDRTKKARGQLQKHPDAAYWLQVIRKFTASDFCMTQWRPGFDALLNETKQLRALEGQYENKATGTHGPTTHAQRRQASNLALLQKIQAKAGEQ